MKNSEDMVNSLLERRQQYMASHAEKKKLLICAGTSLCCIGLAVLVGFGMWHSGIFRTPPHTLMQETGVYAAGDENSSGVFCGDYWVVDNNSDPGTGEGSSSASSVGESLPYPGAQDDIIDVLGMVIVDGVTYIQFESRGDIYTPDTCLGAAADYEGTYRGYFKDFSAKLYTAKEAPDILIVKLANGATVPLIRERK